MRQQSSSTDVSIEGVVMRGGLVARRVADDLSWGEGGIQPQPAYANAAAQRELLETVLSNIESVSEAEAAYSSCTDGRVPVKLLSGEAVPVREQIVGADMVS